MAGVAGVASVQVCKFQGNQFSTTGITSDIFAMANAIYLRYDIHFTLFVCDMPSAFYSAIADFKINFPPQAVVPLLFKEGKKHPLLIYDKKGEKLHKFLFFSRNFYILHIW